MYYNGKRVRLLRVAFSVLHCQRLEFQHVLHGEEAGLSGAEL